MGNIISAETVKPNELAEFTGTVNENDVLMIWLADGTGLKRIKVSQLIKQEEQETGLDVIKREVMAPYGYFGKEHTLAQLMAWVRNEEWDKFAIGDYFVDTMTTGEKVIWEVAEKNGYKYSGDQGNGLTAPHIICSPRDCLNTTYQYNTTNTNAGGYAGSKMPANLEAELAKFSAVLRGYVTEVRRLENNKGTWAWATRKIFLPSVAEVLGHHGWSDAYGGGPIPRSLALFTGGNAHIMKGQGYNKSTALRMWYWLADPSAAGATAFCLFYIAGYSHYDAASIAGGVAPLIVLS